MENDKKYTVDNPNKLTSWEYIAKKEILKWITDESYVAEINKTTMVNEEMGSFTKFLYHFAFKCNAPWGVLIDFNEYKQRVYLPDHYYKWMHKLRDNMNEIREQILTSNTK